MNRKRVSSQALVLLLAGCSAFVGCGGGQSIPTEADPSKARLAIKTSLDAWKRGDKPITLQEASPPIQVADEDWLAGLKLESYELGQSDTKRGLSVLCPATLSLKNSKGRRLTKKVTYNVGTEPSLSVVRQESN